MKRKPKKTTASIETTHAIKLTFTDENIKICSGLSGQPSPHLLDAIKIAVADHFHQHFEENFYNVCAEKAAYIIESDEF
jgi:hypothetical protein